MVDLMKLAEDLLQVGFGDADPGVGDGDLHGFLNAGRREAHRATLRRELDRVGDEIEQHLLELARVGEELARAVDVGLELDVLLGHERLHGFDDLVDDLGDRYDLQPQLHLAGLDLREVEDIVDQAEQVLAAGEDLVQESCAGWSVELAVTRIREQLGEPDDRVERRAQLVAHVGEEDTLVAVCFLQRPVALLELDDQMAPVQRGHERAEDLLSAGRLVVAECGGETSGDDDERPWRSKAAHGQFDHAGLDVIDVDSAHAVGQIRELPAEHGDLRLVHAAAGGWFTGRIKKYRGAATDQPRRPLERAAGEGI